MFDTERFILEVQNRGCLWNSSEKSYSDRDAKSSAWNEIAQILYDNWDDAEATAKQAIIKDLQKKWKHLRDYYTREKKRDGDVNSGSPAKIRKKTPAYFDMLTFIDITKASRPAEGNVDSTQSQDDTKTYPSQTILEPTISLQQKFDTNSPKLSIQPNKKMSLFQQTLLKSMEKSSAIDSNHHFLMSLLPEMRSLNESQNFEFRFGIMDLLRRIKYETNIATHYGHNAFQDIPSSSYHRIPQTQIPHPSSQSNIPFTPTLASHPAINQTPSPNPSSLEWDNSN